MLPFKRESDIINDCLNKLSATSWLDKVVEHITDSGQKRKIKVRHLPPEEREKYKPKTVKDLEDRIKRRKQKLQDAIDKKKKELGEKSDKPDIKELLEKKKDELSKAPIEEKITKPNEEEVDKTIKKPIAEMTDDEVIDKYTPKFSGSQYQKEMSSSDVKKLIKDGKLSADDIAWHVLNGKIEEDDAYNEMGNASYAYLSILNKKNSAKSRNNIAEWMLDKAGVSFIAGASMHKFLEAAANKGLISNKILKSTKDDETRKKIYYNADDMTEDDLRKVDVKEYDYQLLNNLKTPYDVLQKIIKSDKKYQEGLKLINDKGFHIPSGWSSGGFGGEQTRFPDGSIMTSEQHTAISGVGRIFSHPNFPFNEFEKYKDFKADNEYALKVMMSRSDLPEKYQKDVLHQLKTNLSLIKKGKNGTDYPRVELPAFKIPESDFNYIWKQIKSNDEKEKSDKDHNTKYATTSEYGLDDIAGREECPDSVLKEIIEWKNRPDDEGGQISTIINARKKAYQQLLNRGKLSDDEIKQKCADKLNLHGDMDLLKRIGESAFLTDTKTNTIPRTFKKVSDEEKKRITEEIKKTAFHQDFDFDLVDAWEVDNEPHKDFDSTAKEMGNVKTGLFHGTSFGNAGGILSEGIKAETKARTGQMFGQGFYIASTSSKAVQYASENFSKEDGSEGVVFMLDAALGKSKEMKYGRPQGDDLNYNQDNATSEKLKDYSEKHGYECKTKWHLDNNSVTAKAGLALDYDEYVVKDSSQVKIRRILHIKKKPKG